MNGMPLEKAHKLSAVFLVCVFLVAGCGYELEGSLRPKNLEAVQTISISPFLNHTNEPGLGRAVTKAMRGRFLRDGRLRVSDSPDADIALEGVLREYRLSPIAFTRADRVQQYRVVVRTRVRLRGKERKKILIDQVLESYAEFVVTSSLARSSANRSGANQRVADSLSKDVLSLVLEGF